MQKYPFLRFATSVLRVVGWIVLIGGAIASIVVGITMGSAANGGVGGLASGLFGFFIAVVGVIFSFLTWLFLLATREIFFLLIQVEENTRNTAERIAVAEKSGQG
jgi:uncharacterized membrane protein YdbT with pleckstrin-like domain